MNVSGHGKGVACLRAYIDNGIEYRRLPCKYVTVYAIATCHTLIRISWSRIHLNKRGHTQISGNKGRVQLNRLQIARKNVL
jgi:hypothetical protein